MHADTKYLPKITLDEIADLIRQIGEIAAAVLGQIPINPLAAVLVGALAQLAAKAIMAYHKALGIEITPESIAQLLPDPTVLVPPRDGPAGSRM